MSEDVGDMILSDSWSRVNQGSWNSPPESRCGHLFSVSEVFDFTETITIARNVPILVLH